MHGNSLFFRLILALILTLLVFVHVWRLSTLPRGLYVDESSIGYNAYLIAHTARDEHGVLLPIYFKAFGEYKNPLYIYTTAGLFSLFGVSEFTLRLTSALYFFLFLLLLFLLLRELFQDKPWIGLFGLLAAGLLPWFFPLSRIAFEVVSQLTCVVALLLCVSKVLTTNEKTLSWWHVATGFLLGISIYSYSTARLITPLFAFFIFLLFVWRKEFAGLLAVVVGTLYALVPFIFFAVQNPGALTERFRLITYIYDPALTYGARMHGFVIRYFSYFKPKWLLAVGDGNLRHHIGFGGEVFYAVFLLAIVGFAYPFIVRDKNRRAMFVIILGLLIISPVAGALTQDQNALRTVLLGLAILIMSCYGLFVLTKIPIRGLKVLLVTFACLSLVFEGAVYLRSYFLSYPKLSAYAFESYGFKEALIGDLAQNPERIVVSEKSNQPYVQAAFYKIVLKTMVPIYVGELVLGPRLCLVYFSPKEFNTSWVGHKIVYSFSEQGFPVRSKCFK